jgi:hemerythrin
MPKIHWLASMSVGIEEFDLAHQGFISALYDIAAALRIGAARQAERLCADFLTLAEEHGRRERDFLARFGYPDIELIETTQGETRAKIQELAAAIRAGDGAALDMIEQMQQAVVRYLLRGDINFKSFVQVLREDGVLDDYPPPTEES